MVLAKTEMGMQIIVFLLLYISFTAGRVCDVQWM